MSVAVFLRAALPPGILAFHPPNEGRRTEREGAFLKAIGMVPGLPDWCILHRGTATWIELKSARGRLSPAQIACHEALRAAGCAVFIARSLAEVELCLDRAGVPYRATSRAAA